METRKTHKEKERIFKQIPKYDSEIRTIEEPLKNEENFILEVGVFESLGEQGGNILTFFYNKYPTEEEIKKDIRKSLIDLKRDLEQKCALSYREVIQLKILNNLNLK
jgi:hypothetical protein